jgi:hypothetical protein
MNDLGDYLRVIVLILVVAASVLGPLVERWRQKKEEERLRRKAEERGEAPPPPEPEPAAAPQEEPTLPYEDLVQEVFGPYIERRKKAAEEARKAAEEKAAAGAAEEEEEEEERLDREVRTLREPPPAAVPFEALPSAAMSSTLTSLPPEASPAAALSPRAVPRAVSLDERLFRNARLSAGAKLVLASEILGRPKSQRR